VKRDPIPIITWSQGVPFRPSQASQDTNNQERDSRRPTGPSPPPQQEGSSQYIAPPRKRARTQRSQQSTEGVVQPVASSSQADNSKDKASELPNPKARQAGERRWIQSEEHPRLHDGSYRTRMESTGAGVQRVFTVNTDPRGPAPTPPNPFSGPPEGPLLPSSHENVLTRDGILRDQIIARWLKPFIESEYP
jgi:hypothetical protein